MKRFPKPCIDCSELTRLDSGRCEKHTAQHEAMRDLRRRLVKKSTGQYSGDYRARAKAVRETALYCHICGEGARPNDKFEADHLIPADPDSPLAAAHASCNRQRGNKPL
jgi:hypothetical protein